MQTDRYLDLVKSVLVNEAYVELEAQLLMSVLSSAQGLVLDLNDFRDARGDRKFLGQLLTAKQTGETVLLETADGGVHGVAEDLRNFTEFSLTLVGRKRLDHLQTCVEYVLAHDIPGDFLEATIARSGWRTPFLACRFQMNRKTGISPWTDPCCQFLRSPKTK